MIHPTAIVHPSAKLDPSVRVGPYAVIEEGVTLGANCVVGPHAFLTGIVVAGHGNQFHAGCVIGGVPQDLKYQGGATRLIIGNTNVFREHVTVHCSNKSEEDTVIGSGNFLMAHSHVGHNVVMGNGIIVANGALLGGHVTVQDRAFISGNCLLHQFVRVGTLALMQGGSALSKDLPPFTIARGPNGICGLNTLGLRRAGYTSEQRLELKRLYHTLFRSRRGIQASLAIAQREFQSDAAKLMLSFVASAKRGVCADTGVLVHDAEE